MVQKAIENLMQDRTVFVIAHRLSTIRNADEIIVVNDGEIVEQGTHEQLLELEDGAYRALYNAQFKKQTGLVNRCGDGAAKRIMRLRRRQPAWRGKSSNQRAKFLGVLSHCGTLSFNMPLLSNQSSSSRRVPFPVMIKTHRKPSK